MTEIEPILLNDFKRQWNEIEPKVLEATRRVGRSGWLVLGKEVENFEKALADSWGIGHAVGCANGMDAIEIALRASNPEPGFQVLTTPLSAFATTLAILRAGGHPIFVDTDEGGQIDLDLVEEALGKNPKIRHFVPVHLFGHAIDLQRLKTLSEKYDLFMVEDCAQSIGADSNGQRVGTIGKAAATSFYPTKNLGCMGDGGALLTSSDSIANTARSIRDYGQTTKYSHSIIGMNSRLDELQAAILNDALLPLLDSSTERRRAIAKRFIRELNHPEVLVAPFPKGSNSVWHLFPVLLPNGERRQKLRNHLDAKKVGNGIHYPGLITSQPALTEGAFTKIGEMSVASRFVERELSLPIHPYLTENEVTRIIAAVNQWK